MQTLSSIRPIFLKEQQRYAWFAAAVAVQIIATHYLIFIASAMHSTVPPVSYFTFALCSTVLFAGAVSAASFASEAETKTIGLLRRFPVNVQIIAAGKTAWVFAAVFCVLTVTLLSAAVFDYFSIHNIDSPGEIGKDIAIFGTGILETAVWGLFWSPRCRNQAQALPATYLCAAVCCWCIAKFMSDSVLGLDVDIDVLYRAVPYRLIAVAVVAVFAVRNMLHWFALEGEKEFVHNTAARHSSGASGNYRIPTPFGALLRLSLRQSRWQYLGGIVGTALACSCMSGVWDYLSLYLLSVLFICISVVLLGTMFVTVFNADQRNGSYRLLSRLGVSGGQFWLSRMLPALLIYLPVPILHCCIGFMMNGIHWNATAMICAMLSSLSFYLLPFAIGTCWSMFCRQTITAAAAAIACCVLLQSLLTFIFWSAVCQPSLIAVTVLLLDYVLFWASWQRAEYLLRDQTTVSSYVKPLLPFLIMLTLLIILGFIVQYRSMFVSF
ncbi:MAG: hypothetical protein LBT89_08270 [Planctomycetaceae bacterium]|jgi:hypothetical protein|nr:hypothetical protein [Planctomycetaceae bacterium]